MGSHTCSLDSTVFAILQIESRLQVLHTSLKMSFYKIDVLLLDPYSFFKSGQ